MAGRHGGYVEGVISPFFGAYTDPTQVQGIVEATVTRATPFTFNSIYLTSSFRDNLNVTVEGWRNGTKIYTHSVNTFAIVPLFQTFNFFNIDEVYFSSSGGSISPFITYFGDGINFVMDNMTISAVPEPHALVLSLIGFTGGALVIWIKRVRIRAKVAG